MTTNDAVKEADDMMKVQEGVNEGGGEMKNEERMYVRLRRAAFVPSEVSAFVSPILHATVFLREPVKRCVRFFTTGFTTNTVFNTIWILPIPDLDGSMKEK